MALKKDNILKGKMGEPTQVLLLDQSIFMRDVVTNALSKEPDYELVTGIDSVESTLNALKRKYPMNVNIDVVLVDMYFQAADLKAFFSELSKLAPHCRKVIMASQAHSGDAVLRQTATNLGADNVLIKPTPGMAGEAVSGVSVPDFLKNLMNALRAADAYSPFKKSAMPELAPVAHPKSDRIHLKSARVGFRPSVLAIGSSTGGPQALTELFTALKGRRFSIPILITQHMPARFTSVLANQLQEASGVEFCEAKSGMTVEPGKGYVARGDFHMLVQKAGSVVSLMLDHGEPEHFCRPAVDPMLRSVLEVYGERALVCILTGMGVDGLKGSQSIAQRGGVIVAQDEKSSVVWGMPGAVAQAGICTKVEPIDKLAAVLVDLAGGTIL